MRSFLISFSLLALTAPMLSPQAVPVLALQTEDTQKAIQLHARLLQAQKDWKEFQESMVDKYVALPQPQAGVTGSCVGQKQGRTVYYRAGFCSSVQFSTDYRYILPASAGQP